MFTACAFRNILNEIKMDYKQSISLIVKAFLLLVILSGCSEELTTGSKIEPESLKIIGTHSATLYYDMEIELEYGASGGDGVYRYRYIQNPDIEDREEDFKFNPLELEVENNDAGKPSFSLKGIIKPEAGVAVDELEVGTFSYQIEITDGKSTPHVQTFKYELQINKLVLNSEEINASEGVVNNVAAERLLDFVKEGRSAEICEDVSTNLYEEKTLPNGVKVYPYVMNVTIDAAIVEPVEYFYRFESKYNDQLPERDRKNIDFARPNVDFLAEERSITFKPGQTACVVYVNLLDDAIIEGAEEFTLEFYDTKGAVTDLGLSSSYTITIVDNEPLPSYEPEQIIRNEGDKVVGLFSLRFPYQHPLSVQVSIDTENTTASSDDYLLEPSNGVVTIAPGDLEATFTISLLSNDDNLDSEIDEVVSVVTGIDGLLDVTPYQVKINEWPLAVTDEVVGKEVNTQRAVAIDVAESGLVSVLLEGFSVFDEEQAVVIARHRDGTKKKLIKSDSGEIVLAKQGVNVRPVKVAGFDLGGNSYIGVVANVDGLFTGVHRGEGDFIVVVYKLDNVEGSSTYGFYTQLSVNQYGSNGHDEAKGALFDDEGAVYIFGYTTGTEFDGISGAESNKGGEEGFVYKLESLDSDPVLAWDAPRFIGTADQDQILALDAGRSNVAVLVETNTTDKDLFSQKISSQTGLDIENIPRAIISSTRDEFGGGVKLDNNNIDSFLLVDSQSLLPEGGLTPTLTRDINVLLYDTKGDVRNIKIISTSGEDFSTDIEVLPEKSLIVVGGYTDGEFEGGQRKSIDGTDAFISIFSSSTSDVFQFDTTLQFGTAGNDQIIDIETVSENKFLVLWSEDHTGQDGALTYRVSAFSSEGEMLSTEPN